MNDQGQVVGSYVASDIQYTQSPQSTVLTIGNSQKPVGTVQQFDYRSTRSKQPIYVIGSEIPEIVGRSQRITAGRLTGVVLTGGFLYEIISSEDMLAKYMLVFENQYGSATSFNEKQEQAIKKYLSILNKLLGENTQTNDITKNALDTVIKKLKDLTSKDKSQELEQQLSVLNDHVNVFNSQRTPDNQKTVYDHIQYALELLLSSYRDLGARPAIFLDELPPFDMTLVNMIMQDDLDSHKRVAIIDKTIFKDVEFMTEQVSISAGQQQILESMDFVCSGVYKQQEIKDL